MPYVCSRDGHLIEEPDGRYCPEHGSPIFSECPSCGEPWGTIAGTLFDEDGAKFCYACSHPAPWVSHRDRVLWVRDRLEEGKIDPATAVELREVLDRIASMDPGDPKATAGWERLKTLAPTVWEVAKPVLVTVISAKAKSILGLG